MAELVLRHVKKSYSKGTAVLQEVNLTIASGEMFFLLGPSGCGKSTLLRIIAGLIGPDSGEILLDGENLLSMNPEKRNTPMVFQNYALWPNMDVFENVAFPLKIRKFSAAQIRERVMSLLETVQMAEFARRKIPSLSGGQQQRVALARALATDPKVLLLDEPLSNLDAKLRDAMRVEIRRICKERNLTVLYVTHDRREALSMADRIAVMDGGVLRQVASPRDIYARPADTFTASFLGDANFMTGTVQGREGNFRKVRTAQGDFLASASFEPEDGKEYTLMFRPEAVRFSDGANSMKASVRESYYLGEITQMRLEHDTFSFMANEQIAPERIPGSEWNLCIPPEHLVILEK